MTRTSILAASFGLVLAILSAAQAADAPAKTDKPAKAPNRPSLRSRSFTLRFTRPRRQGRR